MLDAENVSTDSLMTPKESVFQVVVKQLRCSKPHQTGLSTIMLVAYIHRTLRDTGRTIVAWVVVHLFQKIINLLN